MKLGSALVWHMSNVSDSHKILPISHPFICHCNIDTLLGHPDQHENMSDMHSTLEPDEHHTAVSTQNIDCLF